MRNPDALVIGVGNPYRGDDGVGVYIAEKLAAVDLPGVSVQVQSGEGAALMDCWGSHDRVYLIDAAAPNGSPGSIRRIEAHKEPLTTDLFHTSSHGFSVLDAIELSRALDTLPEQLIVYGIEGRCFEEGAELSEKIVAAADLVIEQILDEVGDFTKAVMDHALGDTPSQQP